jgi:hypothetical protein
MSDQSIATIGLALAEATCHFRNVENVWRSNDRARCSPRITKSECLEIV